MSESWNEIDSNVNVVMTPDSMINGHSQIISQEIDSLQQIIKTVKLQKQISKTNYENNEEIQKQIKLQREYQTLKCEFRTEQMKQEKIRNQEKIRRYFRDYNLKAN